MLALRLHARCRDRPYPLGQVDLAPARSYGFARPCGGQDDEPQCHRRDAGQRRQSLHEGRDIVIGQRLVMPPLEALARRQDRIQAILPLRGVLPLWTPSARLGESENPFYAATEP